MSEAQDLSTCKQPAGVVAPVIDSRRCEGKADCVRVCPYDVFEIRALTRDERGALPLAARLKVWAHGGKQAFAVRADQCHACGQCVAACPENAIRLSR
jgi:NAD-dependent dihydropyrimidine dehydrogenase PreA subunit